MHHAATARDEHTALPAQSIGLHTTRSTGQIRADWPEGGNNPHPRAVELADAMRETAASAGGATVADLLAKGFTMAEITEHEPEARKLADEAIMRQVWPAGDRVPEIIQKALDAVASRMPMTAGLDPDEAQLAKMRGAWGWFCTARAAFKLDPWVSQSERCVHRLDSFMLNLPVLPRERNRIIYALAAEQKAVMSRSAANG